MQDFSKQKLKVLLALTGTNFAYPKVFSTNFLTDFKRMEGFALEKQFTKLLWLALEINEQADLNLN